MKTFKKVLCVILSVIMAMSCLSAVAMAADTEDAKFTDSLKYYTDKKDAYGTDKLLDIIDVILADVNLKKTVDLKVTTITVDLTSVNGLCDTLDLIQSVWGLVGSEAIVGDLYELNFDVWKSGMSRGTQDETILKEILEFLGTSSKKKIGLNKYAEHTNGQVIAGLLDGEADIGLIGNFIDLKELIGADGLSGIIKGLLIGLDYKKGTEEYEPAYNKYKNDMDTYIYESIDKLAARYLPGFTMDEKSTVEDLICIAFDLVIEQYLIPALKKINVDLSTNSNAQLQALNGIVNLNGASYDFSQVDFSSEKTFMSQINNVVGKIFTQIVPGYTWVEGDYTKINENIEGACKYVGKASGIIPNADEMTLDGIVKAVIEIVVQNVDLGSYDDGITECSTLEDMVKVVLINASNELEIGVKYDADDSYLVVIGDIVAYYAYNLIDIEDTDGNDYQAGGGKDIFEVLNYIANYFLFDKGVAKLLGLNVKNTQTIFQKADKLLDFFGANKATAFDTKALILGAEDKKGLLDSVFSLDIQNIVEITAVTALEKAGNVSLIEFLYKSVQYFMNNMTGKKMVPDYQSKAFTNLLSNATLGNMIHVLLSVLNERSDELITLIATAMSVISSYKLTSLIYAVIDFANNGAADAIDKVKQEIGDLGGLFDTIKDFLASNVGLIDSIKPYIDVIAEKNPNSYTITEVKIDNYYCDGNKAEPTATVKVGSKTLTQGKDYLVKTSASEIGSATAKVVGIGYYEGAFEVPFNVVLGKVSNVSESTTDTAITLTWKPVVSADSYNVYILDGKNYVLKQSSAETSFKAENLKPGTDYSFKIEAVSAIHGAAEATVVDSFTRPAAVNAKTVKATSTDSTITLTWTKADGATGYRVDQYLGGGKWKKVATVSSNTATIKGLKAYSNYYFRIWSYARDKDKSLVYGTVSKNCSARTAVSTVTNLKATTTSNSIKLTWDKKADATGYQVYQYKGGKWVRIKNTTATSLSLTKLSANTKYSFKVRAYKKLSSGYAYGEYAALNVYTNLAKTTNLKVTKQTTSSVTLSWSKVSGAQGYQVYMYKGGKWVRLANTTKNSYTVSKLAAGTTYKFYVRAYRKNGSSYNYGENSSYLSAKTALNQVKNLKASSRKKTTITLKWDKVTGATGYQVYQYKGGKWVKVATVKTNTATVKSLTRNTQYQFKVRAYGTVNGKTAYGSYSSTLKAKTTLF